MIEKNVNMYTRKLIALKPDLDEAKLKLVLTKFFSPNSNPKDFPKFREEFYAIFNPKVLLAAKTGRLENAKKNYTTSYGTFRSTRLWELFEPKRNDINWKGTRKRISEDMLLNKTPSEMYTKNQKIASNYIKGPESSRPRLEKVARSYDTGFSKAYKYTMKRFIPNSLPRMLDTTKTYKDIAQDYLKLGYFVYASNKKRDKDGKKYIEVFKFKNDNEQKAFMKKLSTNYRFTTGTQRKLKLIRGNDLINILSDKKNAVDVAATNANINNFVKLYKNSLIEKPWDKIYIDKQLFRFTRDETSMIFGILSWLPGFIQDTLLSIPRLLYYRPKRKRLIERFGFLQKYQNNIISSGEPPGLKSNERKQRELKEEITELYNLINKLDDAGKYKLNEYYGQITSKNNIMNNTTKLENKTNIYKKVKNFVEKLTFEQKKPKDYKMIECYRKLKKDYAGTNPRIRNIRDRSIIENMNTMKGSYLKEYKAEIFRLCKKYKYM